MDVEPEVVEMEVDSASDGAMVGMELENECEDDCQELVLTQIRKLLLLYREEDGNQELELTTKDLELTTIELEEEQTGPTDKSETKEIQPSLNTTQLNIKTTTLVAAPWTNWNS